MRPLQIREEGDVLVMTIEDVAALNEGQAVALRQAFSAAIEARDRPQVALDLSAIDYVSSTGIAFLIGTKRRVEAKQGVVVLFGLQPEVAELFKVMKLSSLFEIAVDEDQALKLFLPPPSN